MMNSPDNIIEAIKSLIEQANGGYMDLAELARYSSLGKSTIRAHIAKSGLPAFKVDGKLLFRRSEVDAWLKQFRVHKERDLNTLVDTVMADLLEGKSD